MVLSDIARLIVTAIVGCQYNTKYYTASGFHHFKDLGYHETHDMKVHHIPRQIIDSLRTIWPHNNIIYDIVCIIYCIQNK